jgi:deoxyribose-phosphate aldolase
MKKHIEGLREMLIKEIGEVFPDLEEKEEYALDCILGENIAPLMDHTILKADTTESHIEKLAGEAEKYGFYSICIPPCYIPKAWEFIKNTDIKICTVIGFPLGFAASEIKAKETKEAVEKGASEVDMVINIGWLKSKKWKQVKEDIESVVRAANGKALVKVILETAALTTDEKIIACLLAQWGRADFVKTSTGFGGGGASVEDILLMKEVVGNTMGIKASGGIKSYYIARKMIEAGACRLGTSASIDIVEKREC